MAYVSQEKKAQLAPAIKAVLKKYNMKASISVRHHSSLVVTLKSGAIDFGDDRQVNEYWIDQHYTGVARNFLTELLQAMKGPDYFNEDDSQTDYFHRSHYTDINIGRWDRPYVFMGAREFA
jgi:hypothetical protein